MSDEENDDIVGNAGAGDEGADDAGPDAVAASGTGEGGDDLTVGDLVADGGAPEPAATDLGAEGVEDDAGDVIVGVEPIEIQTEMEQSFLDYAMSVIVSRALPDARDGLKPVHRRIIWGMHDGGHRPDRSHVKSARVVGDVMGKYHPHGDSAIYDSLVRMGQDFSLRDPLIHPHGNFGSPSDPPAAARYTECRLTNLAMRLTSGIDEDTVDMIDNYDASTTEPEVLPARFPNLLVNGSQGIAVGMATNIPPHNLGEVIDATVALLDNPDATPDDLMEHVKGPDFPTGALILGRAGLESAYRTGKGSIKMRAVAEIEEDDKGGTRIVVTELPYQVSAKAVEEKLADLVDRKVIDGVRSYIDESSGDDTRLVFQLKRDAPALVVLNLLYKYTPLQTTFSANMVALDDGVPRTMNLRDALVAYVDHQIEVLTRRSEFRLEKARARAHILEGLIKAIGMIDDIIALIRGSANTAAAREGLMAAPFEFSEVQAQHILDMPLRRLTQLGRAELQEELDGLRETIAELEAILGDEARLRALIREELLEVKEEFETPRRSQFTHDPGEFDIEDLIDDEELVFTMTDTGYVKTVSTDEFRTQGRGGRGITGAKLKDGDFVDTIRHTTAHAYLLFFTNHGKVYRLKAHEIPMQSRTARGVAIVNLLQLEADEHVAAVVDTRDYETQRFLLFVTKKGVVKKTLFSAYDSNRANGLWAIKLREGDELVRVMPTDSANDVCIVTRNGRLMRFHPNEVREMGRVASGVRGIKLKSDDDEVVSVVFAREDHQLLLVTDNGYGKRTEFDNFNVKHRGGQGVIAMKLNEDKGHVMAGLMVTEEEEVILISSGGVVMRTRVADISLQGASATGVTVMSLAKNTEVAAVTQVPAGEGDDEELDGDEPGSPAAAEDGAIAGAGPVDDSSGAVPSADAGGEEE